MWHQLTIMSVEDLSHESIVAYFHLDSWEEYQQLERLCIDSRIDAFPDLPRSLTRLDCSFCKLTRLPDQLPEGLVYLSCGNNMLTHLPRLPDCLVSLSCDDNRLTHLPDLPSSLETLDCEYNPLVCFPTLPPGLKMFYCRNDVSTPLPDVLPETLKRISGHSATELLHAQYNGRCNEMGLQRLMDRPSLEERLRIKKQYDIWRFQLDGPEWNKAIAEIESDRFFDEKFPVSNK